MENKKEILIGTAFVLAATSIIYYLASAPAEAPKPDEKEEQK